MTVSTLFSASPLSQLLGAVVNVIPVPSIVEHRKSSRTLPIVLPHLFEINNVHAEQLAFLDNQAQAALTYIKSLSFLKLLQNIEEQAVFPVWRSSTEPKSRRSDIKKLVKILNTKEIQQHNLVTNNFLNADYLGHKHEWARSAFSLMLDFGLIRLYREKIFQDGLDFPIAVNAIKALYFRRLAHLDLSEKAWCDEGIALDANSKTDAVTDLRRLLAKFEKGLCAQAKEDANVLITYMDKPTGVVKRLAIENHFFQCYRELFITSGMNAPRFSWQLKSNLSKSVADKLIADFA